MKYWKKVIMLLFACGIAQSDFVYDLQANLALDNAVYIEQQPFYYDSFYISSSGPATLTFDNYDANLVSTMYSYDSNDPYLYLYTIEQPSFNGWETASVQFLLFDEDDDGNEEIADGLYFFLDDVYVNNEILAVVSSYDPYVIGTVDFTITSDKALTIIPEPTAVSLIAMGGLTLLFIKRKYIND